MSRTDIARPQVGFRKKTNPMLFDSGERCQIQWTL